MSYTISFVMDQIAGHITNYHNLRSVAASDSEIAAAWHEIYYHKSGGAIEQLHEKVFRFLPSYVTGIARGTWEVHKALRPQADAIFTNTSVGGLFSHVFRHTPTLIDFDATPIQIDQMDAYSSPKDAKPVAYLKWRLRRDAFHAAAQLQAWSHWAKQSAICDYGVPAAKIVVNPPGINLNFWRPDLSQRQPNGAPLKLLFVGGDFDRKGGRLLLDWYRGQQPDRVELHLVTRDQVAAGPGVHVYRDMQPNTERLLRLYHHSDLFVLPSLGECFGIATIEAMATGLPVIASDVGGTADIIEPDRNGYIVPGNDLHALSQAIDRILGDASRRQRMGQQSRDLAEERFDLQTNARRTLGYLKAITDSAHAPATEHVRSA